MQRSEVLIRYRWLMQEAETLTRQANRLVSIGAPAGVGSQQLTGMPHGTNDPTAAAMQAFDGYVDQLRGKAREVLAVCGQFEKTLDLLADDRARTICRMYYALGMTDEQIAEKVQLDRSTITVVRNKALAWLDGKVSQNSIDSNKEYEVF